MNKIFYTCLVLVIMFSINPMKVLAGEDPYFREYQRYLLGIGFNPQYVSYSGKNITVAVIDDGVWLSHPELDQSIWTNKKEIVNNNIDDDNNGFVDDVYGWNFFDNNLNMMSYGTHGTAVASVIVSDDDSIGMNGIAPDAKIMSLIACNTDGCPADIVISAIRYAIENGAKIINLSLGSSGYIGYNSEYDAVMRIAREKGVIVVVSAGNGDVEGAGTIGQNLTLFPVSPVCNDVDGYNYVIGVGSNAEWSNYGNCVDIFAPGLNILVATVPIFNEQYYYDFMAGTSFSAPMVSGAIALLLEKHPDWQLPEILSALEASKIDDTINIPRLLSYTDKNVRLKSVNPSNVFAGEYVLVEGEYFRSTSTFRINGNGKSLLIDQGDIIVLDNKHLKIKIPETLASGTYKIIYSNDAKIASPSFVVTNADSISEDDSSNDEEIPLPPEMPVQPPDPSLIDKVLTQKLIGRILLQVQQHGEAWYVHPDTGLRYYMKDGPVAYQMMRKFSLGITDADLAKIPSVATEQEMLQSKSACSSNALANRLKGRILLQVQQHGEAWYIHPDKCRRIYMKDGESAYSIMRYLSLGITDADLAKIATGTSSEWLY